MDSKRIRNTIEKKTDLKYSMQQIIPNLLSLLGLLQELDLESRAVDPDPDPYLIRIQLGLWIRIRNPDPDPGGQN